MAIYRANNNSWNTRGLLVCIPIMLDLKDCIIHTMHFTVRVRNFTFLFFRKLRVYRGI